MSVVNSLNTKIGDLLEKSFFKTVVGLLVLMNPIALVPQVWEAFAAPSVEGVSIVMWIIFAFIQIAMIFEGIRVRSAPMFWSMVISSLESVTIIIVVLVRM